MEKPRWVTIVGILAIVFGAMGILNSIGEALTPKIFEFQKEMIEKMEKDEKKNQANNNDKDSSNDIPQNNPINNTPPFDTEFLKKMFDVFTNTPEWYDTWLIISGITKSIISIFYLIAGIILLQLKPAGIRLFYWAASASILYCIIKGFMIIAAFSLMGILMTLGGCFGLLIDIALIYVVSKGDKTAFRTNKDQSIPNLI